jgi:hypothetical protein
MQQLQMVGQRDMLCGMHVHVELPDPDRRISVMTRLIPYVPLLLALSTSSPFWRSRNTGLKGYRLAAYDELPRSGLPELFWSYDDYEAYVSALVCSGAMPDATHIWWAIRPSHTYPTLELRAPDCCTRLDDAVAIAALYRALVRYLYRNPAVNADITAVDRAIAVENKWIAQRYGVEASFATPVGAMTVAEMLGHLIEQLADDAKTLGCAEEMLACCKIVTGGTSADAQLRVFRQHRMMGSVPLSGRPDRGRQHGRVDLCRREGWVGRNRTPAMQRTTCWKILPTRGSSTEVRVGKRRRETAHQIDTGAGRVCPPYKLSRRRPCGHAAPDPAGRRAWPRDCRPCALDWQCREHRCHALSETQLQKELRPASPKPCAQSGTGLPLYCAEQPTTTERSCAVNTAALISAASGRMRFALPVIEGIIDLHEIRLRSRDHRFHGGEIAMKRRGHPNVPADALRLPFLELCQRLPRIAHVVELKQVELRRLQA